MAVISITVPDGVINRVRQAFRAAYNYQDTINGQPNPESLNQFVQRKIREYVKEVVKSQEAPAAAETARKAALDAIEAEIPIT